ncbi:excisionase family DNA-binding protein [Halobacillus shinanisalinarum]|uniref:Excisionase family DNA-binding protein n=1 Tax=Halobacillus shinanisalinarum TaxID=2932258 RepID=A0ABY4GW04_9BACI|nr:excisionase family DNA-binding protein [Halobacillus shinanisalinarum]UOQ92085.1 excisionase family DNA-binding protein [Halobacillus shinanisalinarum]
MYLTIEQIADYLDVPQAFIQNLIRDNRIRTIHDGKQYLINKSQFNTHFEQIEKYRAMIQDYFNEPLPDDPDIKDED